ncbi:adenylosuccinate synthase [Rhodoflexus caldus]|uniref:adenylosuccinate synthase n=1 Tax=Rhodoflexus caldus TaxID=2891236 RepID=UPI00202A36B1|nr:adenylosuccinate synthase [Rhodoflexus caldus]
MCMDILLGLQWGDEGKGKIVDFIAPDYQVVARFQGGPNAGHTLHFDGIKHVLHQIPSGAFRPEIKNLIGNGVVLDLHTLKNEILSLTKLGVDLTRNLFISKKAQLIIPTHRALDAASEKQKGENKIGSTLRGIGPTYADKVARVGLRVGDILLPDFKERYNALKARHLEQLRFYAYEVDLQEQEEQFFEAVEFIKSYPLVDSEYFINNEIRKGSRILAEGAQGSLLDIDFGSYPFVTSSNTTVAGACTGLGVAPHHIGKVLGIFKAYCTRVGSGPFPTELFDETGERLRRIGHEFGATTGRPRRCGWLDLPALKYAVMINHVTNLLMMKADVLNEFEEIMVCTHYELPDGTITDQLPYCLNSTKVTPVYQRFTGWQCELTDLQSFEELPAALADYIRFIEQQVGVPVTLLSYGSNRKDTLMRA